MSLNCYKNAYETSRTQNSDEKLAMATGFITFHSFKRVAITVALIVSTHGECFPFRKKNTYEKSVAFFSSFNEVKTFCFFSKPTRHAVCDPGASTTPVAKHTIKLDNGKRRDISAMKSELYAYSLVLTWTIIPRGRLFQCQLANQGLTRSMKSNFSASRVYKFEHVFAEFFSRLINVFIWC